MSKKHHKQKEHDENEDRARGSGSGGTRGSGSGGTNGSGTGGSGSGGTKGSGTGGTRGSGSGGTKGSGSGGTGGSASSSAAYHNGGVEGDSLAEWYENNIGQEFQGADAAGTLVLDLSNAGAAFPINQSTGSDGTQSGTVEFRDASGQPVAWGHFNGVDEVIPSEDPDSHYYSIEDFDVIGEHGEGMPPKVSLDAFLSQDGEETDGQDPGGSGSGGTKGSGTGGTGGSGSGGTGASGTASTATAAAAALPAFSYHEGDEQFTEDDVMALMNQDVEEQEIHDEDDDMESPVELFI